MRIRHSLILAGLLAGGALPLVSFSQAPPPPPTVGSGQPLYNPQQFPAIRGVVQQFTLSGRGEIDGMILKDGTEVKSPPLLSTQLAYSVKPGDEVTIRGLRAAALPLVSAVSITDEATHRTVTDYGPAAGEPPPPPPPPPGPLGAPPPPVRGAVNEISGRVRMALHGPQGEVNGVLLDSGTVLRLPPDQAAQFAALLQPRQFLVAQGVSLATSLGTVVEVQAMGASRAQLQPVGPMPPPPPGLAPPPPPAPGVTPVPPPPPPA